MRRILVVILIFSNILVYGQTKNVLFIGNSYTFYNNMPQMVVDLASTVGDNMTYSISAPSGYTLYWHTTNTNTLGLLQQGGWDFVVLQEYSLYPSELQPYVDQYVYPSAQFLDSQVNTYSPSAETVFYMTWGRKDGDATRCPTNPDVCTYIGMDNLTRQRYMYMAQANHAIVSPVGAVWRYIRNNYPSIDLYDADLTHPSPAGSYAAACTFYTTFFRKDPSLLTFNSTLSADDASNIRNAAKMVVYDSLLTWHIGEYDIDTQAPSIPSGLSSSGITSAAFTLSWNASTDNVGVTDYQVFRNGTLYSTVTSTSANITGLSASTTYSMTVKARDAKGNISGASTALNVTTASATAITLTISGVTAGNKVYNGSTAAVLNTGSAALVGVVPGDVVNLVVTGATGTFSNKNVGTGKTVNTSGFSLSGADASKYVLSQPATTASITALGLTVSGLTVNPKIYNGTTAASLNTSGASLSGAITGDLVSLVSTGAAGTFSNKNAGTGKTVTVTGFTLGGTDAGNYTLSQPPATGNITAAAITVTGVTANNKVYDGSTAATLNTSGATLSGVISGDAVTLSSSSVTGAFGDAGTGIGKTVYISGYSISGTDAGNYTLTQPTTTANITGLPLTLTGVTANNKVYNGTTSAILNSGSAVLHGVVTGDVVTLVSTSATGTFSSKTVGAGKTVTTSGYTLSGTDATKYLLTQPSTTANITAATLTVTGVTANTRVYNGTTAATLNAAGAVLAGVISGDVVTLVPTGATGSFTTKSAGTGKAVTTSGFTLGGADGGNYTLTQPSATGTITALSLTVTGVTAANKIYNGTTSAVINAGSAVLSGVLSGDAVTLVTSGATGSFANKNAGNGKSVNTAGFTLTGTDAGNYTITQPVVTANITTAGLTITGVTANTRAYNGTAAATLNAASASLAGIFGSDIVTIVSTGATGTFEDSNAGTGKLVTTSGFTLGGADGPNYTLTQPSGTGTITPASLTITGAAAENKIYDGTVAAVVNTDNATLSGIFGSDDVSLEATGINGTFNNKNAGNNKPVTSSGFAISGADALNYTVLQPSLTANITNRTLTITAKDLVKDYRDILTFTGNEFTAVGLITGDALPSVTITSTGAVETAVAGKYPITITGGNVANYNVTYVNGTLSVQKDTVIATADNKSKTYGAPTPKLTISYTGFVKGEDVTVLDVSPVPSTIAGETSDAGNYSITLSAGSDNNYDIVLVSGSLTIDMAVLNVTAEDKTRPYGSADPAFTVLYSGFVDGQTSSVIDNPPVAGTSAGSNSDVGEYEITVSGGNDNNYSFTFTPGTLTITKADQVITFPAISDKLRVTQQYHLNASSTSQLPIDFVVSDENIATLDGDILTVHNEGKVTITASQPGDQNWNPATEAVQEIETYPTFDHISSLFTPNSDGMNDYWYIPNIDDYGKIQVTVYNRYGQVVYKSDSYKNDWDGTWNGNPLPSAAYYYIIKSSEKGFIKGVVNIVR